MLHLDKKLCVGQLAWRAALLFFCMTVLATTAVVADELDAEAEENTVYKPKLWFLRETQVGGIVVPLSPLSIFFLLLATIHLVLNWGTYSWCEASHILIKDHSPEAKQALKELKDEIGSDYTKFAEMAKKHSDCPSGRQGGSLNKFYRGDMANNFDKACFDPKVPTKTTVGPLETSFGWHLIFIQNRSIR